MALPGGMTNTKLHLQREGDLILFSQKEICLKTQWIPFKSYSYTKCDESQKILELKGCFSMCVKQNKKIKVWLVKCLTTRPPPDASRHKGKQLPFCAHKKERLLCDSSSKPRVFTWIETQKLCTSVNQTLPILLSRSDQENLINIFHYTEDDHSAILPMEAIFIGLKVIGEVKSIVSHVSCSLGVIQHNKASPLCLGF